jgi:hypothetical protein
VLLVGRREAARSVGESGETMMRMMIERYVGPGTTFMVLVLDGNANSTLSFG